MRKYLSLVFRLALILWIPIIILILAHRDFGVLGHKDLRRGPPIKITKELREKDENAIFIGFVGEDPRKTKENTITLPTHLSNELLSLQPKLRSTPSRIIDFIGQLANKSPEIFTDYLDSLAGALGKRQICFSNTNYYLPSKIVSIKRVVASDFLTFEIYKKDGTSARLIPNSKRCFSPDEIGKTKEKRLVSFYIHPDYRFNSQMVLEDFKKYGRSYRSKTILKSEYRFTMEYTLEERGVLIQYYIIVSVSWLIIVNLIFKIFSDTLSFIFWKKTGPK
ncbi:hypothetical protein COU80_03890 [Candidatus Peregrinibacteria bacterium CG10_big_fil_rev_8_21_14_0_10_55_24]|nr:MAG: hypothetical protein COU80_03890 [Candidatus Peregrinibacteria bacterium CG10_big_fil_rev_8_21_14_0_10_55_24]